MIYKLNFLAINRERRQQPMWKPAANGGLWPNGEIKRTRDHLEPPLASAAHDFSEEKNFIIKFQLKFGSITPNVLSL